MDTRGGVAAADVLARARRGGHPWAFGPLSAHPTGLRARKARAGVSDHGISAYARIEVGQRTLP